MDSEMFNEIWNHARARWEYVRRAFADEKVDDGLGCLRTYPDSGIDDLLVCDNFPVMPRNSDRLNVVSWNVATCDDLDGVLKYLRDLDSRIGVDVFALQEVGINLPTNNYRNGFVDLCDGLSVSGVYGGAMFFLDKNMKPFLHDGRLQHMGEAVLSKAPIDFGKSKLIRFPAVYDWRKHVVPASGNFINSKRAGGRVAVSASIEFPRRFPQGDLEKFMVTSVHLEDKTFCWEKARQVKYLLSMVKGHNQIVAGDFNTFFGRWGPIDGFFLDERFERTNESTPTAKGLPFRLDNVYSRSNALYTRYAIVDKSVKCSDHYPLVVQFQKV